MRAVVVNYRDVTEREHAAAELARHDALLGGLFDSIPDVICYEGRDLKFLGGNPAFEELAGRPMAEMLGLGCEDIFQDEWASRLRAAEREVLASGRTLPTRDWVTYPDGRKALLDILLTPLCDAEGRPLGLIVVGRDVTEQDRLEEHLRQAQKRTTSTTC